MALLKMGGWIFGFSKVVFTIATSSQSVFDIYIYIYI